MKRAIGLLVLGFAAVVLLTGAGRKDKFTITFHVQGEEHEGTFVHKDPQLGEGIYFRKVPVISHNDMKFFYPFLSADGQSYGAVFPLSAAGQQRLATLKVSEPGRLLRAVVSGVPVDTLKVDRGGASEAIVIWRGLSEKVLKSCEKKLERRRFGV